MSCWCAGGITGYNQHRKRRLKQRGAGEAESPFCQDARDAANEQNGKLVRMRREGLVSVEVAVKSKLYFEELDLL